MEVLIFQEIVSLMSSVDDDDVNNCVKWLRDMIDLDKLQRYMLLKLVFRSQEFTLKEKEKLLDRERSFDLCDVDEIEIYGVHASLPQDENKLKHFEEFIKYPSVLNVKQLEASAKFFYNFNNREQCEIFADKFFENVESVFKRHFEVF